MSQNDLPIHWAFSLAVTTHELEQLALHFDSTQYIPARNYASIPAPEELQSITQGFLRDPRVADQTYQRRLVTVAQNLDEIMTPHYNLGARQARELWKLSSPEQQKLFSLWDAPEVVVHAMRYTSAMIAGSARSWFIQGFCFTWWHECFLNYIVQDDEEETI